MANSEHNAALSQIYREHVGLVWRQSRRMGMTPAEAEDTVHEVFLVVHRRLHLFDHSRSMANWLCGITRNVVLHQRRGVVLRLKRHMHAHERAAEPTDFSASVEARALVGAALKQLTPERREVLILVDVEGLTAPEVAETLALNLSTVYSRLRRARRDLAAAATALDTADDQRTHHGG